MMDSGDMKYEIEVPDGVDPRDGFARFKTTFATANPRMERKLADAKIELKAGDVITVIERKYTDQHISEFEVIGTKLPFWKIENVY